MQIRLFFKNIQKTQLGMLQEFMEFLDLQSFLWRVKNIAHGNWSQTITDNNKNMRFDFWSLLLEKIFKQNILSRVVNRNVKREVKKQGRKVRSTEEKHINVPYKPTNVIQRFITYYGTIICNRLPQIWKINMKRFKIKTKQFLMSNKNNFMIK